MQTTQQPMPPPKAKPAPTENRAGFQLLLDNSQSTPRPKKWARVLRAMLNGRSLNRFEATRDLNDWCLHSTVARLQTRGVTILRREETVAGYAGNPTRVMRYWLAPESRQMAEELLGRAGHAK